MFGFTLICNHELNIVNQTQSFNLQLENNRENAIIHENKYLSTFYVKGTMKNNNQFAFYHINAFTDKLFSGNPAAVCLLPSWYSEQTLIAIAKENNLPVTAFLVRNGDKFEIRWITPEYELELCGHGSLSAGHVIFNYIEPEANNVTLQSRSELLSIARRGDLITLNFPVKEIEACSLPLLTKGLQCPTHEIYQHKNERCLAVLDSEETVKQLKPNLQVLRELPHRGITVTAPAKSGDFVSRTFYPHKMIAEDPVTGASHCLLAPYWAKRLNKVELHAKQISERGGELICQLQGNRVLISGKAVTYLQGTADSI